MTYMSKCRPDERMIADGAKLHESIVDPLEGLGGIATLTGLHLSLYQAAQSQLVR